MTGIHTLGLYGWKARNDKLFKGIDRDPGELVRHAESECQSWHNARENMTTTPVIQEPQVISSGDICLIDGSWTSTDPFSGLGWVWKDSRGTIQLMGMRNLRRRESALHSELEALRWAMETMQQSDCQRFDTDCKDLIAMLAEPKAWPSFSTELEMIHTIKLCYSDFKICYVPRSENVIADSLARNSRTFHRSLCYFGCSIPVVFGTDHVFMSYLAPSKLFGLK
ncbi:uncharacterized protein LOC130499083 [Raphanus sativus]|uniref:Uncharacterized protein LOC130499083 n=1 Tax=Raphanus sativus TaxID=3726 RepID=A0A9W3CC17_RAPSA|nr:uncharacterized protein LOC130499083 [Raphanus sativus]